MFSEVESFYIFSGAAPGAGQFPLHRFPDGWSRFIEVGPGAGEGLLALAQEMTASTFVGLEPDAPARSGMLSLVRERGLRNLAVLPIPVQDFMCTDAFDIVLADHLLCAVPDENLESCIASLPRLMNKNSTLFIDDFFGVEEDFDGRVVACASAGIYTYTRWFHAERVAAKIRTVNRYEVTATASGRVIWRDEKVFTRQRGRERTCKDLLDIAGLVEDRSETYDRWLRYRLA